MVVVVGGCCGEWLLLWVVSVSGGFYGGKLLWL